MWCLLAVGANDVIHLTCVSSMRRDLLEIVRRLRGANERVAIVITGSPDMGSPPRVPRLLRPVASWRTHSVNRMFRAVAASQQLTFARIAEETGRCSAATLRSSKPIGFRMSAATPRGFSCSIGPSIPSSPEPHRHRFYAGW